MKPNANWTWEQVDALIKQRDALVAALEGVLTTGRNLRLIVSQWYQQLQGEEVFPPHPKQMETQAAQFNVAEQQAHTALAAAKPQPTGNAG